MSVNLIKPDVGTVADKGRLLQTLVRFYERLIELGKNLLPSQVPALKAWTMTSLSVMRQTLGDANGELGPRACMLLGGSSLMDGSQAFYYWNATDTRADNGTTVIQPAALSLSQPGRWNRVDLLLGFGAGRLLRAPQVLTAGTTITHPAGTKTIVVEVIGGGGGGGGAVNSAAANITLGAGGGSGAYAEKTFAASSLTSTYAIGTAGAAGANTGAAAGNGGSSTFTHGGVTVTAPGGNGAPANTGAGMAGVTGAGVALAGPGGAAAVATGGDLNEGGTDGGWGCRFSGTTGQSGGGAGIYGGGGGGRTTQGNGNAATGPGAGGAGGLSTNAGGAVTGGTGGTGLIIVREYS